MTVCTSTPSPVTPYSVLRRVEAEGVHRHEAILFIHRLAGLGGFAVDFQAEGVGFGDQLGHEGCCGAAVLVGGVGC